MDGNHKFTTVDEYIAQYPEEMQPTLAEIRTVIKESAPGAEEKISYNIPAYFLNGRLIYFSVNKRHIGIYPLTSGMEAATEGLSAYKGAKASIHFRLDRPIPYDLLRQIVRFRVAENTK